MNSFTDIISLSMMSNCNSSNLVHFSAPVLRTFTDAGLIGLTNVFFDIFV